MLCPSAIVLEEVIRLDFEEVITFKRVKHPIHSFVIFNVVFFLTSQGNYLHALLTDSHKVFVLSEKNSLAFTLPKLEAFMTEEHELIFVDTDVHRFYSIDIDIDYFVGDN